MIDYDAIWSSEKLCKIPAWAQLEYLWMYGLADANGSFEITNPAVVRNRISAIRPGLKTGQVVKALDIFEKNGLMYVWKASGKTFAHWTGSDRPGRLPQQSHRTRYRLNAPPIPKEGLTQYLSRFTPKDIPPNSHIINDAAGTGLGVGLGNGWLSDTGVGMGVGEGVGGGEQTPQPMAQSEAPKRVGFPTAFRDNHCKDCGANFTRDEFFMHRCPQMLERIARQKGDR